MLTTAEAGAELGVSRSRVLVLIDKGRLPATRLGNQWVINRSDLSKVRVRKTGRPRKR